MAVVQSNVSTDLSGLRLQPGEEQAVKFFKDNLNDKWEIYIQPFLNGCRPDVVLLNPDVGIAVFEVKDWNLETPQYGFVNNVFGFYKGGVHQQVRNPIVQIRNYRSEIFNLYCPRLDERYGQQVLLSGLIFPNAEEETIKKTFAGRENTAEKLWGKETLNKGLSKSALDFYQNPDINFMNEELANDLRGWLIEPDHSIEQREPLKLNSAQKTFISSRTGSGYRRIRGAAGSGKSVVIASRAAVLAAAGLKVLVISYNITLNHYLRDLCARYPLSNPNKITWLNFHEWLKRSIKELNLDEIYNEIWKAVLSSGNPPKRNILERALQVDLPNLLINNLKDNNKGLVTQYDAILLDEGQDFNPLWWSALRKVLKRGGEMVMAADVTQDIYDNTKYWTDVAMQGAGFTGAWGELTASHRLPPALIPIVTKFGEKLLKKKFLLPPIEPPPQEELFEGDGDQFPCKISWIQTDQDNNASTCANELLNLIKSDVIEDKSFTDLTLLVDNVQVGQQVRKILMSNDKGIKVSTTFEDEKKQNRYENRRKKLAFWKGNPTVKISTFHSFKGWEARLLVINVTEIKYLTDSTLFYIGLTRVKKHPKGSFLSIVTPNAELKNVASDVLGDKYFLQR